MTNPFYTRVFNPLPGQRVDEQTLKDEYQRVEQGFDGVQAAVAGYAGLNSPAFTGTPTAPTAPVGANTTQIATTAHVFQSIGLGTTPAGPLDYGLWFWNGVTYRWSVGVPLLRVARSSNTILGPDDLGKQIDLSGGFTQTVTAAATLGATWRVVLNNAGGHDQPIDPNGTETIDGQALYTLKAGWRIELVCDGANFRTNVLKRRTFTTLAQVTATTVVTIPADTYVFKPYAFGQGGTATGGGGGGGCAYGDIPCIPGQQFTLSIAAGVAKVSSGGIDYLTANPAAGTVAGTASKHSSVQNGGAYSGGTGGSGGGGASSGSPLGAGVSNNGNFGGCGWGGASGHANGNGGGSGGPSTDTYGGPAVSASIASVEPLLATLNGASGTRVSGGSGGPFNGTPGGRGAGGGAWSGGTAGGRGGDGGFGAGGGYTAGAQCGNGGFGGGGASTNSGTPGAGGLGGGGGGAAGATTAAGGAAAILYWMGD